MIRVDRSAVPEPASLSARYKAGRFKGKTEAERVLIEFDKYVQDHNGSATGFKFDYERYSDTDVKKALEALFHGKCAYCEARYAGTQPVDVEHWRPKAEVIDPGGQAVLGYFWLASAWENLLPSCIDCNRQRTQRNFVTGAEETAGKANQFPVNGARMALPTPGGPPPIEEDTLLINPCLADPAEHLEFHSDGSVTPLNASPKGNESIRVYALNRTELAMDRLSHARLVEQRLRTIEGIANAIAEPTLPPEIKHDLEDLVSHEIAVLLDMAEPNRPFSALTKRLIKDIAPG